MSKDEIKGLVAEIASIIIYMAAIFLVALIIIR